VLAKLKTLSHGRVYLEMGEYLVNTKSPLIPTSIGEENTEEVNKGLIGTSGVAIIYYSL
jgi:hypothetical protein